MNYFMFANEMNNARIIDTIDSDNSNIANI